jgi:cytochrome P450
MFGGPILSTAPRVDVDVAQFWRDPYPTLAKLRRETPIAFVPQLGSTLLCSRDDIYICEKQIEVFSSDQPDGLMTRLMGHNMMRKDGQAHLAERRAIFPAVSPKTVKSHWTSEFHAHADRIISALEPAGACDFVRDLALPFSAECLKSITGLTNMRFEDMNAWSQGMIDGIANYVGDPAVEARCHAATAGIDAAIDDMVPVLRKKPDQSLLGVTLACDMPVDSIRANIKLAISGGQNEPRDAIAGTVWALLTHPDQLAQLRGGSVPWIQAFEEYARWISPIGMSPRRVAKPWTVRGVDFEREDRVFLMFGSANRDEQHFERPDAFDIRRDTAKSIAFGAGPHFCAGAWASRAMVADVALPRIFARLKGLRLAAGEPVRIGGWAFRGLLNLPVAWD